MRKALGLRPAARTFVIVTVALTCATSLGQSAGLPDQPQTFHVQGTISGPAADSRVPGTEIHFQSDQGSRIVFADNKGFYQADLPVGLYTMTAQRPSGSVAHESLVKYVRPVFRVTKP